MSSSEDPGIPPIPEILHQFHRQLISFWLSLIKLLVKKIPEQDLNTSKLSIALLAAVLGPLTWLKLQSCLSFKI
jgi:hypothetical protein